MSPAPLAVVALGGGHGLHATLSAARRLTDDVTAVVTVADDGGSSGRLRRELDVLPPGDLRMALSALAAHDERGARWTSVVQHRFGGSGALAGHPVGNLLIAGLAEVLGDPVAALDEVARILGVRGRVLPMSRQPLEIEADVVGLDRDPRVSRRIRGQVAVATTPGQVRRVRLIPAAPAACAEAVSAVARADVLILGPGSWFSSVIPHLLVPQLLAAVQSTSARRVVVLNLVAQPGETAGFSAERHLHVLSQHAPDLRLADVLVDSGAELTEQERVHLERTAAGLGAVVRSTALAAPGTAVHDPQLLARALAEMTGAAVAEHVDISGEDNPAWR